MLTNLTLIVLIVAAALALFTIVLFVLALNHDKVVTAQGPLATLEALMQQISQKEELKADLEGELEKRREALANVGNIQAEVDALVRQKDELLSEWATLEERRSEVQAVRSEMEEAMIERQNLDAELAQRREEYLAVKERLDKAEGLVSRIEALKSEHEELAHRTEEMRNEVRRLEDAEKRVADLDAKTAGLEAESARLDGRIAAKEAELEESKARIVTEREALVAGQVELSRVQSTLAASELEAASMQGEINSLSEKRETMQARLTYLEGEIQRAEGAVSGTGGAEAVDPLKELKEAPKVITELRKLPERPSQLPEAEAILNVQRQLKASGLEYPRRIIRAFHTAMKVNESTQMAVLAGISGTGKSQLPRQYAKAMGIGFLQVPVQPRWDSPQDLMGFYNYIEGKFRPTDMARALWALDPLNNDEALEDRMMMVLLDEMNLARVEYYFSDFLSRLESRPSPSNVSDETLRKDAEIELEIPKLLNPPRIFPGYNLLFAGTMNEDESTQSLSDKVVDRANILRFSAPQKIKSGKAEGTAPEPAALSQTDWQRWLRPVSQVESDRTLQSGLETMVDIMKEFKRPFGHRLGRAIMAYAANYPELEGSNGIRDALADQVEMRLLPKLRGVEVDNTDPQFSKLRSFVEQELGDHALAEAIAHARMEAEDSTGQFVWTGVTR
ncbi:McrB family protein [Celeribacter sp. PS-C1]|uniref:McrB family protein n=1 Tax=Celeribacter sp. PS-C1 TaxID=2820813 RepID=UPI001CA4E7C2|nr:chromosome segregation ATPase-like protein [Celeribacter sp. PS-C1]MBW6419364.1 chromosome segregation ATPase-like protein [Celeribacter sp. PS-C1]